MMRFGLQKEATKVTVRNWPYNSLFSSFKPKTCLLPPSFQALSYQSISRPV